LLFILTQKNSSIEMTNTKSKWDTANINTYFEGHLDIEVLRDKSRNHARKIETAKDRPKEGK